MQEASRPAKKSAPRRVKVRREDVRPGEILCHHCTGKCCRYFALQIDTPTDWQEFDYIKWYLLHEGTAIFVEDKCWYLLVNNRCKQLRDDRLCDIYDDRPQICRDYGTAECEYDDDCEYEQYWDRPEQVQEYAESVLGPRKAERPTGKKPQPKTP